MRDAFAQIDGFLAATTEKLDRANRFDQANESDTGRLLALDELNAAIGNLVSAVRWLKDEVRTLKHAR